jgi:WhiB family redox-sensing transcriptional regulator
MTAIDPPRFDSQALCAEIDPDLWFPEKGGNSRPAKQVCQSCEVRDQCLQYALDRDVRFGIWGGLSERERRRLRVIRSRAGQRATGAINHGTEGGYKAHRRRNEDACADCLAAARLAKGLRRTAAARQPSVAPPTIAVAAGPSRPRPWRDDELAKAVAQLRRYGMTYGEMATQLNTTISRVQAVVRQAAA